MVNALSEQNRFNEYNLLYYFIINYKVMTAKEAQDIIAYHDTYWVSLRTPKERNKAIKALMYNSWVIE